MSRLTGNFVNKLRKAKIDYQLIKENNLFVLYIDNSPVMAREVKK